MLKIILTLLLGAVGGAVAARLHVPLPWMLGPLLTVALACVAGAGLRPLPGGRKAGQWAIGSALGLYFSPSVVALMGPFAPVIVVTALCSLLVGLLCGLLLYRSTGEGAATAFFAALPGGASEMATLAEGWGGAVDRIAAAHALRVLLVVSCVPLALSLLGAHGSDSHVPLAQAVDWGRMPWLLLASLAGVALLGVLRMANAWVLGPLLGVGVVTAWGIPLSALPAWVVNGGQLLIGVSLGCRFSANFFHSAPRFLSVAALSSLGAIGAAALLAAALTYWTPSVFATLLLAAAPGGVSEMCITAKVLQLGVPLVTVAHVFRVLVITVLAGPMFRVFQGLLRHPAFQR